MTAILCQMDFRLDIFHNESLVGTGKGSVAAANIIRAFPIVSGGVMPLPSPGLIRFHFIFLREDEPIFSQDRDLKVTVRGGTQITH